MPGEELQGGAVGRCEGSAPAAAASAPSVRWPAVRQIAFTAPFTLLRRAFADLAAEANYGFGRRPWCWRDMASQQACLRMLRQRLGQLAAGAAEQAPQPGWTGGSLLQAIERANAVPPTWRLATQRLAVDQGLAALASLSL